MGHNIFTII